MGRVGRDARLLFVLLWTLCDDSGRTRAASRMLASLLYPYDDDAPKKISGWLDELEKQGCIRRYVVEGDTYLEVLNWLKHQKIDRPSQSKIPAFDEASRLIASDRECSALDQGSRIKDQGRDQGGVRANGAHPPDESPLVETLPLIDGSQFEVKQTFVTELEPLYPQVDIPATIREMKGWLIGNPTRRKTRTGVTRFITKWLQDEQQKATAH
jgi:hypothetical protein